MAPTCVLGGTVALILPLIFSTTISVEQAFTSLISNQFFIFHTMIVSLGLIRIKSDSVEWSMKHFKTHF